MRQFTPGGQAGMTRWQGLRVTVLLLVLLFVGVGGWLRQQRVTSWEQPLRVSVQPLNGDGSEVAGRYAEALSGRELQPVAEFLRREAGRYGIGLAEPVELVVGPLVREMPPTLPPAAEVWQVMEWSLRLRWWAWQVAREAPRAHVRAFVLYHDPALAPRLPHSTGLDKGMVALVHLFARPDMEAPNQVVLAHELLHVLGATDKYDPATNLPRHPDGYGDPQAEPRFPQRFAELMGGRLMVAPQQAVQPESLDQVVVGPLTAWEIGWYAPPR